jgi:hypothetical protein
MGGIRDPPIFVVARRALYAIPLISANIPRCSAAVWAFLLPQQLESCPHLKLRRSHLRAEFSVRHAQPLSEL